MRPPSPHSSGFRPTWGVGLGEGEGEGEGLGLGEVSGEGLGEAMGLGLGLGLGLGPAAGSVGVHQYVTLRVFRMPGGHGSPNTSGDARSTQPGMPMHAADTRLRGRRGRRVRGCGGGRRSGAAAAGEQPRQAAAAARALACTWSWNCSVPSGCHRWAPGRVTRWCQWGREQTPGRCPQPPVNSALPRHRQGGTEGCPVMAGRAAAPLQRLQARPALAAACWPQGELAPPHSPCPPTVTV